MESTWQRIYGRDEGETERFRDWSDNCMAPSPWRKGIIRFKEPGTPRTQGASDAKQEKTRNSAIAEGPRDALCQLKSCQVLHAWLDFNALRRWRSPPRVLEDQVSYSNVCFNQSSSFNQIQVHGRIVFLHTVQPLLSWSSSEPRSINASTTQYVEVFQPTHKSTAAQLNDKSHLKRFAVGEWPWRSLKVIGIAAVWQAVYITSLPNSGQL